MQWTSAADFGQDLLEFFINDVECIITESATATGVPSSLETAVLLMRYGGVFAEDDGIGEQKFEDTVCRSWQTED